MTRLRDWFVKMKLKSPSLVTRNETVLINAYSNENIDNSPPRIRESSLSKNYISTEREKASVYRRFSNNDVAVSNRPSCVSIFLIIILMMIFLILPIIYLLHCFGLVHERWSNQLFVPVPGHKHGPPSDIHYSPGSHVHDMLNNVDIRTTRSLPITTPRSDEEVCSNIPDSDKIDCYPENDSSESTCLERNCCWKVIVNNDYNAPYCYYPKSHKKYHARKTCPKLNNELKLDCFPEPGSNENDCLEHNCCWEEVQIPGLDVPYCFYKNQTALPPPKSADPTSCSNFNDVERIDCHPEWGASEQRCVSRGCCWVPPTNLETNLNTPYCFYPHNYGGYKLLNMTNTAYGLNAFFNRTFRSTFPNDVNVIKMIVKFETENRLRVKIVDPEKSRWEPPYPEVPIVDKKNDNPAYVFEIDKDDGGFKVVRKIDGYVIWDSTNIGAFIYSDQVLQISSKLGTNYIYGLGEHETNFRLSMKNNRLTIFNSDQMPIENAALYGAHPMYLGMETSGNAHGVFLLNSNAMDIWLREAPSITFRTIGGILDFYILAGPSPADVIREYTDIVGRPMMPPLWGLGFHLCRYGYKTLNRTRYIMQRNLDAGIPIDVQWNDLDYMEDNNMFTMNKENFKDLPKFVDDLHKRGMHYVPIIDPGISGSEKPGSYPPYDRAIKLDILTKNDNDKPFIGKVWNTKSTVWPDFTNPKTLDYWTEMFKSLHKKFKFDGAWIDMNEPSNFLDGSTTGCPNNLLENPPYVPFVNGGKLRYKTMCMSAKHYAGRHYNVHNLYALAEAMQTNFALAEIRGKRPFIISRGSFAGLGHFAGHWSGDVTSTWQAMKYSIPQLLRFSLYGVPLMGADICGFNQNTTAALCQRWSELGAFYPFSRNHNTDDGIDQDPAAFGEDVIKSTRKALRMRYELLPYLYTAFWRAHVYGDTVARPLFFEFPKDINTFDIDDQFMWGYGLMICPVVEENVDQRSVYFPAGHWYSMNNFSVVVKVPQGERRNVKAPAEFIPVYIKGGQILPMQKPAMNTQLMRNTPIRLVAAPDDIGRAYGQLYWDDGDSLNSVEEQKYTLVDIDMAPGRLTVNNTFVGSVKPPPLERVTILGVSAPFNKLTINGKNTAFHFDTNNKYIIVDKLSMKLTSKIEILWN